MDWTFREGLLKDLLRPGGCVILPLVTRGLTIFLAYIRRVLIGDC